MKARVTVTLKSGILDPQGKAIEGALKSLGLPGVASRRKAPRQYRDRELPHRGDGMRSAVIVFPGINRERDMARALKLISGREPAMVWHADTTLPAGTDLAVIPGGFSYGDYLRCGAIAARAPIMDAVRTFAAKGGLVLAVCNGFQIACEAGLLPGVLMRNAQLRFICRDVYLRVERSDTAFTRGYNAGQVIRVPVAHGEGNYIADGETIARLEGEGRVVFRYASPDGIIDPNWNHNGAMNAIAGIVNERGNVLGMMPHPENHVEAVMGRTDGRGLFAGLVDHFKLAA
jgi:phosphoribosylformylglycinamidine synthase I